MKRFRKTIKRYQLIGVLAGLALAVLIFLGFTMMTHTEMPLGYDTKGITIRWLPETVLHHRADIESFGKSYNLNANLIAIVMTLESGGYTRADSGVAKGLMQVTDYTGSDIAAKFLKSPRKTYDLYNAKTSVEFGAAYLARLRGTFCDENDHRNADRCVEAIAAGYNGGPGAAIDLLNGKGLADMQTVIYSRNAMNMWRERDAETSPTFDRWKEAGGQSLIDNARQEQSK